jgi:adenosylcobyric acid synthase
MRSELSPVLMVQGVSSSAGKSTLVTGLCRLLARRGLRVAPFKAQNMSNNAAVCADGGEIGRAQYVQALAAGIAPTVDMNPVLLKPQGASSQVIVRGQVAGAHTAAEYFSSRRRDLWPTVTESLDRLRRDVDLVIAEGAGSPAEINLRARDIANMSVALHAAPAADVLLVADIDRGGAFAALLGTFEWLAAEERALVRGFVLNKFRGDASLLAPAPAMLEQRTGVAVVGVVPYLADLGLPEEDAATLAAGPSAMRRDAMLEIAVVRLPHISNFDEFGPLSLEPGVSVRYVDTPRQLRAPDLVILPGSKATVPDLVWLHERGLAARIGWLAEHHIPVLGICGGMQMLGQTVRDPLGIESSLRQADGVGLLPVDTLLNQRKTLRQVNAVGVVTNGFWSSLRGIDVSGYEIHVGQSSGCSDEPLLRIGDRHDGLVRGLVAGTYVHGIFETAAARAALLRGLATRRGFVWQAIPPRQDPFDRLADVLEATLDLTRLSHLKAD